MLFLCCEAELHIGGLLKCILTGKNGYPSINLPHTKDWNCLEIRAT